MWLPLFVCHCFLSILCSVFFGLTLTMDSQYYTLQKRTIYTLRNEPNDLWPKYVLD